LKLASQQILGAPARDARPASGQSRNLLARGAVYRIALLCVLLFAFVWQGFVAQTHHHLQPVATAAAATLALPDQSSGSDQPSDVPANCSICRDLASGGPALLPVAAGIAAPSELPFLITTPGLGRPALVRRTHLWRSRAPPFLQA
jgi:hypothetical protein